MGKPTPELRRGRLPSAKATATVSGMGFRFPLFVMDMPDERQPGRNGLEEAGRLGQNVQASGQVRGPALGEDVVQAGLEYLPAAVRD